MLALYNEETNVTDKELLLSLVIGFINAARLSDCDDCLDIVDDELNDGPNNLMLSIEPLAKNVRQ